MSLNLSNRGTSRAARLVSAIVGAVAATTLVVACSSGTSSGDSADDAQTGATQDADSARDANGDDAAGDSPADADANLADSQELRYGLSAEPAAFKTGVNQGTAAREILTLIHRGLLKYDAEGLPAPALAESYDVSDDGLTYTFTLRQDLTFSDGTPLTSEDVKGTFEYLADPENGADSQATFANVDSIDASSPTEVVLNLAAPQTSILTVLADPMSAIAPPAALEGEENTVGAGPFMISDYSKGVGMTLVPFPDYYAADDVNLTQIEMTFIADADTRVQALLADQVDMIDYVPRPDYDTVDTTDGYVLDMAPGIFGTITFNHTKPPFDNKLVRQAVAYAVDAEAMIQAADEGYGTAMKGLPIPQSNEYFVDAQPDHFGIDLDKARDLLAEAGYPDGFEATILSNSQYPNYDANAQVVKANLAEIGIDIQLVSGDYANQIQKGNDGDYQMAISGIGGSTNDPANMQIAFLGGPSYLRSYGIDQTLYEDILKEAAQTSDGSERHELYQKLADVYFDDVPFLTVSQGTNAFGYKDTVSGFNTLSGIIIYNSLYNMENVYIAE